MESFFPRLSGIRTKGTTKDNNTSRRRRKSSGLRKIAYTRQENATGTLPFGDLAVTNGVTKEAITSTSDQEIKNPRSSAKGEQLRQMQELWSAGTVRIGTCNSISSFTLVGTGMERIRASERLVIAVAEEDGDTWNDNDVVWVGEVVEMPRFRGVLAGCCCLTLRNGAENAYEQLPRIIVAGWKPGFVGIPLFHCKQCMSHWYRESELPSRCCHEEDLCQGPPTCLAPPTLGRRLRVTGLLSESGRPIRIEVVVKGAHGANAAPVKGASCFETSADAAARCRSGVASNPRPSAGSVYHKLCKEADKQLHVLQNYDKEGLDGLGIEPLFSKLDEELPQSLKIEASKKAAHSRLCWSRSSRVGRKQWGTAAAPLDYKGMQPEADESGPFESEEPQGSFADQLLEILLDPGPPSPKASPIEQDGASNEVYSRGQHQLPLSGRAVVYDTSLQLASKTAGPRRDAGEVTGLSSLQPTIDIDADWKSYLPKRRMKQVMETREEEVVRTNRNQSSTLTLPTLTTAKVSEVDGGSQIRAEDAMSGANRSKGVAPCNLPPLMRSARLQEHDRKFANDPAGSNGLKPPIPHRLRLPSLSKTYLTSGKPVEVDASPAAAALTSISGKNVDVGLHSITAVLNCKKKPGNTATLKIPQVLRPPPLPPTGPQPMQTRKNGDTYIVGGRRYVRAAVGEGVGVGIDVGVGVLRDPGSAGPRGCSTLQVEGFLSRNTCIRKNSMEPVEQRAVSNGVTGDQRRSPETPKHPPATSNPPSRTDDDDIDDASVCRSSSSESASTTVSVQSNVSGRSTSPVVQSPSNVAAASTIPCVSTPHVFSTPSPSPTPRDISVILTSPAAAAAAAPAEMSNAPATSAVATTAATAALPKSLGDSGFEDIVTEESCSEGDEEQSEEEVVPVKFTTFGSPYLSTFTMASNSEQENRRPRLLTATIRRRPIDS